MYQEVTRQAERWAQEMDRTAFGAAKDRLRRLNPMLPADWQLTDELLERIGFHDDFMFTILQYNDLMRLGYQKSEAQHFSKLRSSEKVVTYLESSDQIVAQPLTRFMPFSNISERLIEYMSLIVNSLAKRGLPMRSDLSLDEVADTMGLDSTEATELLVRNFLRDPYMLAKYVEETQGIERDTFFKSTALWGVKPGMDEVSALREQLRHNYVMVLDKAGVFQPEYEVYVRSLLATEVSGTRNGRILSFTTIASNQELLPLGELSQSRDLALKDLFADTFSLMIVFMDYLAESGASKKSKTADQIRSFKTSEAFKKRIGEPSYLCNLPITDLAIACGSFQNALDLLLEANTVGAPETPVSRPVRAALEQCIEAYRTTNICQYLLARVTTEPEFADRIQLDPVEKITRKVTKSEDLGIELLFQVVQQSLQAKATEGVWDISTGSWGKNEHIMWQADENQPEAQRHPDCVLSIVSNKLHDLDDDPEAAVRLLQEAQGLLQQTKNLKRMNK